MSTPDPIILDTLERILDAHCDATVVEAAEDVWPAALWEVLEQAGLPLAWVPEHLGGAGASLADGFAIIRVAGRFAVPVPLAETLLAGWVLSEAGIPAPTGPATVLVSGEEGDLVIDSHDTLHGQVSRVPHARHCATLIVVSQRDERCSVATIRTADCAIDPGDSLCGEARDAVSCQGVVLQQVVHGLDMRAASVIRMAAAIRAEQLTGALESILSRSLAYAAERHQFGRPIQASQAVQHNLAELAGETVAATAAADAARRAIETWGIADQRSFLGVASAKIRCGQAATSGAAIAHQVHGAMGFAREYPLHQLTRRVWTWRDDYGSESEWAERLGQSVCERGVDVLWEHLTEL